MFIYIYIYTKVYTDSEIQYFWKDMIPKSRHSKHQNCMLIFWCYQYLTFLTKNCGMGSLAGIIYTYITESIESIESFEAMESIESIRINPNHSDPRPLVPEVPQRIVRTCIRMVWIDWTWLTRLIRRIQLIRLYMYTYK